MCHVDPGPRVSTASPSRSAPRPCRRPAPLGQLWWKRRRPRISMRDHRYGARHEQRHNQAVAPNAWRNVRSGRPGVLLPAVVAISRYAQTYGRRRLTSEEAVPDASAWTAGDLTSSWWSVACGVVAGVVARVVAGVVAGGVARGHADDEQFSRGGRRPAVAVDHQDAHTLRFAQGFQRR